MIKYMYFDAGELHPRLLIVEMTLGSPLLHPVKSHPLEAKAGNPSSKRSQKRYIYIFVKNPRVYIEELMVWLFVEKI